jgi:hypothetical protein
MDQWPKIGIAGVDQTLGFRDSQISNASSVDVLKRLDLPPRFVCLDFLVLKCLVERGAKRGPRSIY